MHKKSEVIGVRITESQKVYLEEISNMDDRTLSWIVQKYVEWFRQNKTPEEALKLVKKTFSE
jgi:hypothetical protein